MAVSGPLLKAGMGLMASASEPRAPDERHPLPYRTETKNPAHFRQAGKVKNVPVLTRLKQNGVSFEKTFTQWPIELVRLQLRRLHQRERPRGYRPALWKQQSEEIDIR